jgi:acyl-CoA dehydrogenase
MSDAHLDWPFLDATHRALAASARRWIAEQSKEAAQAAVVEQTRDVDAICRRNVASLGAAGLLRECVPARFGGAREAVDSRAICVVRETLAQHDGLADFSFAMQGLGAGPIALGAADDHAAAHWARAVGEGAAIAAFALSEPDAGSDVAAMSMQATPDGDHWLLNGSKTWISNGGIADFYCVFARTSDEGGARGISAFVVPADTPGLAVAERIAVIAPHPLARIEFRDCRVPAAMLLGKPGEGFKLAMRTLDIFRASVGAAAVGLARRALDASLAHARTRRMFGGTLADRDLARATLGEMGTDVDAAALLVYRAAWRRDVQRKRATAEAAMAKMQATESAQRVIDQAVQMHGGLGVTRGQCVEQLYREVRALRIYEGATEVQKLVIGRELLRRAEEDA